jgi:hypothetical protein
MNKRSQKSEAKNQNPEAATEVTDKNGAFLVNRVRSPAAFTFRNYPSWLCRAPNDA